MPQLTNDIISKVIGYDPAKEIVDALNQTCDKFQINTPERIACFLAQTAHESNCFKALEENLNYSSDALLKVFPKYFDATTATAYARQPEKIASRVYGGRMGNGPEATKEGYKFRGRGVIQITGKDNYTACGKALGVDFLSNPEKMSGAPYAFLSAGWFWNANNLNSYADKGDFVGLTKRINGGTIGIEHRTGLYAKALSALGVKK